VGAPGVGGERVEGRRAVTELLTAGRRRVRTVWVAAGRSADLTELADDATRRGVPVQRVTREELDDLAATEVPQGVVADADPIEPTSVETLLAAPDAFLVALDGVTDPQNLGAIVRAAETAGALAELVAAAAPERRRRRRAGSAGIAGLRDRITLEEHHDREQRAREQDQLRAQHVSALTRDQHDGRRHQNAPEEDHRLGGAVHERSRAHDVAQVDGDADEHEAEQRGRRAHLRQREALPVADSVRQPRPPRGEKLSAASAQAVPRPPPGSYVGLGHGRQT